MAEFPSKRAAAGTATGLKIVGKQTFARACEHNNTVDQQRVYVPPPNPSSPLFASLLFSMHPLRLYTGSTPTGIYIHVRIPSRSRYTRFFAKPVALFATG